MKPWAKLLCVFALSSLGVALQNKPPPKKDPSFCGFTKAKPNYTAPDCKHNLNGSCLVDNNTCNRMPMNMPYITVLKDCACDLYEYSDCAGPSEQSWDGIGVMDAILFGPMWYYKCKRIDEASDGKRKVEVRALSLVASAVLMAVFAGLAGWW